MPFAWIALPPPLLQASLYSVPERLEGEVKPRVQVQVPFRRNGGSFKSRAKYDTGFPCRALALADFSGDGATDVVTANAGAVDKDRDCRFWSVEINAAPGHAAPVLAACAHGHAISMHTRQRRPCRPVEHGPAHPRRMALKAGGRAPAPALPVPEPPTRPPLRCLSATSPARSQTSRPAKGLPAGTPDTR
jgi:hypothetical protein